MVRTKLQISRFQLRESSLDFNLENVEKPEAPNTMGRVKCKRRFRPGVKALLEMRKYQATTNLLIPMTSFQRVVRDITQEQQNLKLAFRFQSQALLALQEASEYFLVGLLEDAQQCAFHAKRKTVMRLDLLLACRLRGIPRDEHTYM